MTTLCDVPGRQAKQAGGIDSLESIPGLLKRLVIRALETPPPPFLLTLHSKPFRIY